MSLLEIRNLKKHFPVGEGLFSRGKGVVKAVDGVSLTVNEGETLGLVGESGCGKSTLGRAILRLIEPTSGEVIFHGKNLLAMSQRELRDMRREMQIIFQDPFSSLNPRLRVVDIVGEALAAHGIATGDAARDRVADLLAKVGISRQWLYRYPHEFSGGQRQRIGVARALALNPKLIVCDEAVSALDVSIRAQVLNLLIRLRNELNLAYLFISHDLSVVRHIAHRVAVMYLGELVELGPSEQVFNAPAHPYTRALLSAVPVPNPRHQSARVLLTGDVPTPINPPTGCRFHTRCPAVIDRCSQERPELHALPGGHTTRCFHAHGLSEDANWQSTFLERCQQAETANRRPAPSAVSSRPPISVSKISSRAPDGVPK
jgi:oligopeptide/dipeptide ABC transporter ATP-binding protein